MRKATTPGAEAGQAVSDYRYDDAKRKNIPPAGLAAHGRMRATPKLRYAYDPHLPPALRFDATGRAQYLDDLIGRAIGGELSEEDGAFLRELLGSGAPWLEWAGKREAQEFVVDPVALHTAVARTTSCSLASRSMAPRRPRCRRTRRRAPARTRSPRPYRARRADGRAAQDDAGQPALQRLRPAARRTPRISRRRVDRRDAGRRHLRPGAKHDPRTRADKVAAWFLDTDYDGRTFCITQAFFPDSSAWKKLARALRAAIDEERFDDLTGTTSLPFRPGKHRRVAVKVIDPRGNEVLRVIRLPS